MPYQRPLWSPTAHMRPTRSSFITLEPTHRRFIKNSRSCGVPGTSLLLRSSPRPTHRAVDGNHQFLRFFALPSPLRCRRAEGSGRDRMPHLPFSVLEGSFLTSERSLVLVFCPCGPRAPYLFVSASLHSRTKYRFHVRVQGLDPVLHGSAIPSH